MNMAATRDISYRCLLDLSTQDGINASGRDECFGCIFGRDSAYTVLKILKVLEAGPVGVDRKTLLSICKRTLLTLIRLQGKEINIESGEEPGKFIHEYRPDNHEQLSQANPPWYVYPDGSLKMYDTVDATPLILIAIYRYWQVSGDDEFLRQSLPAVEAGLSWLATYGDPDGDGLVEFTLNPERKHYGHRVQTWTDSAESMIQADGTLPPYPIAAVEVQGFTWLALKLWEEYFKTGALAQRAELIKHRYNETFLYNDGRLTFAAQALDGQKRQIRTVTCNPLLLLWASYRVNGTVESILDSAHIPDLVRRAMLPDMFDPDAGIRTMSALSPTFNPGQNSYHNGSFWPLINGLVHEGLLNWDYHQEAAQLKQASFKAFEHFGSPIELYIKNGDGVYYEFDNGQGQRGCRNQAWSAAVFLDLATHDAVERGDIPTHKILMNAQAIA